MSFKPFILEQLPKLLEALGQGPAPDFLATGAGDVDDETLMSFVGVTARKAGYTATADPTTIGETHRMLTQLIRDYNASVLGADLPDDLPPGAGPSLGGRQYILYLRSFHAPLNLPVFPTDVGMLSLEEAIASNLSLGPWPLIGLGKLDNVAFGAGKLRSPEDTWKRNLKKLSLNATLILVVPSTTEGTSWELEWVAVNRNLRNSIFLMPPAFDDLSKAAWRQEWLALQRWARFMGLTFPDYDSKGLFFTINPQGPVLRSVSFGEWFIRRNWWIGLMELTGPSSDWIGDMQKGILSLLEQDEAEGRGIDLLTLFSEIEKEKEDKIHSRLAAEGGAANDKYYPMLERLDTVVESTGWFHGTMPGQRFSDWPPDGEHGFQGPGAFTIWWGTKELVWVGCTSDLYQEMSSFATGDTRATEFCNAVYTGLVLPSLDPATLKDLDAGLIDQNKMTRFFIHKNLSVLVEKVPHLADAENIVRLIGAGVLSVGRPRLKSS